MEEKTNKMIGEKELEDVSGGFLSFKVLEGEASNALKYNKEVQVASTGRISGGTDTVNDGMAIG